MNAPPKSDEITSSSALPGISITARARLVLALTGIDPDRLKEEKARGITIELGFAHAAIDDVTVAFVDVPGHERFVKTMLAGVGGLDCVMLVIAADESVMPQTREHFDICRLLQVRQGIVVLTKSDLVDAETLELVRLEVRELVEGSFLEHAPVLSVSARTGDGLDQLRAALVGIAGHLGERLDDGPARLPIDRAFTMQGFGTVVTGTLVGGSIKPEDELALLPGDTRVRVRGVQVHGKRRGEAAAGQRTAVNLGGIDVGDIHRGQTLASPAALTRDAAGRCDAAICCLARGRCGRALAFTFIKAPARCWDAYRLPARRCHRSSLDRERRCGCASNRPRR